MKKKYILCSGLRTYALSAEWKKMTYQGSFTTPQDIYVYQEPQPQQPIQKPYNPHPGVSLIFLVINILFLYFDFFTEIDSIQLSIFTISYRSTLTLFNNLQCNKPRCLKTRMETWEVMQTTDLRCSSPPQVSSFYHWLQ